MRNAFVTFPIDRKGNARYVTVLRPKAIDGFHGKAHHLALHRMHGVSHALPGCRHVLLGLAVGAVGILLQESRLGEELERRGDFGSRNIVAAHLRDLPRSRPRHHRSQFTDNGILPAIKILDGLLVYNAHLVLQRNLLHFLKVRRLAFAFLGVAVIDHRLEIVHFVASESHRIYHAVHRHAAQVAFAFTHEPQVGGRRKSCHLRELPPGKVRGPLAFLVIILDEEVIILIFNYRFHVFKYSLIF